MEKKNKSKLEKKIIVYNYNFVPQPGWKICKTNSKIESFDWNSIRGEYWDKDRTTEVCNLYNSCEEDQVPFNLSVLMQLMREGLVPEDWKIYLENSLPASKEPQYDSLKQFANHPSTNSRPFYDLPFQTHREMPIKRENTRAREDSLESIAFVGTVYLNHNGNPCVPALYIKPNRELAVRYICPKEMLATNGSALAHVHGFRDRDNNLPSTIAYGMINL